MRDEPKLGRTIRIYLADGSPMGIRHAELVNMTIQAVVCPRSRVAALQKWPEAQRPGVYMLVGEDENGPLAYIGESENVLKRLPDHLGKREWWQQVVFVTSKDDNLTKAHVKYVESRFQSLAERASRIPLQKGKASEQPNLPKPDRDAMEEYILNARILLSALGFPYLDLPNHGSVTNQGPSAVDSTDSGLTGVTFTFSVKKTGVQAQGALTDEGFVVFQGSVGAKALSGTLPSGWTAFRQSLFASGAIVDSDTGVAFVRDVLFKSPSAAAAILAGGSRNGLESWKASDGRTMKQIEEAQANLRPEVLTVEASVAVDEEDL
jgi:hypothetical protein